MSREAQALLEPLSADNPCGEDLEDTQLLSGFDAYHLFGSAVPLPADTDWRAIREQSLQALAKSHDLRLLAHLAAAAVRLEGLTGFFALLPVADRWLSERWDLVYPRVDDDAILRKNALNCFADRMAVVDGVRRSPFASQRQLGSVSLRDVEMANGQLAATEADSRAPNSGQIEAVLTATSTEDLAATAAELGAAMTALRSIIATMQSRGGFESAPDFDPLMKALSRIEQQLTPQLQARGAAPRAEEGPGAEGAAPGAMGGGPIKSRQEAIRALDTVAAFFRSNEPSSPVPLLLDRAKRLISKSFMEVLEDIAPDSLTQVRLIGGIKNDQG